MPRQQRRGGEPVPLAVPAHVESESKIEAKLRRIESSLSYFSFKSLVPSGVNVGLIGSTCTALPWPTAVACTATAPHPGPAHSFAV